MANYIDREAIKYEQWAFGPYNRPLKIVRKTTIDSIPAADAAPVVHARWIERQTPHAIGGISAKCSVCAKSVQYLGNPLNYCPNCGARMDGDSDALD